MIDGFFSSQEQRDENSKEKVEYIDIYLIFDFANHPFKIIKNDEFESLKESIKIIREWTELTQQDFAKSINRSSKTIEGYEYGKINYNFDTFMKICKKHGIEIIIKKK